MVKVDGNDIIHVVVLSCKKNSPKKMEQVVTQIAKAA